jgi:hypothetical protein
MRSSNYNHALYLFLYQVGQTMVQIALENTQGVHLNPMVELPALNQY